MAGARDESVEGARELERLSRDVEEPADAAEAVVWQSSSRARRPVERPRNEGLEDRPGRADAGVLDQGPAW